MKTLKIIGLIMLFGGVLLQIVDYFLLETSAEDFFVGPFFWGAVITCVGALLWTIHRFYYLSSTKTKIRPIIFHGRNWGSKAHDSYKKYTNAGHEERNKNVIIVDTNVLPTDRHDVYFGSIPNIIEDSFNSSYPEKMSEEDKRCQQMHCQLTTPGLWPCE